MADQPPTQSCANCRYLQARAVYRNPDGSIAYQHNEPVCKRYPQDREQGGPGSGYPSVEPRQWCGEWAPAHPETVEDGCVVMARLVLLGDLTAARALSDKLRE